MQYRNIAKRFIYAKGATTEMVAADGVEYGDNSKAFAPGPLEKANDARATVAEQLANKWDIAKADR